MEEKHTPQQGPTSSANGQVAAPSISLPKGGEAIRGIGEKFAANPVTGTGSLTIPLPASPGRSGFRAAAQPQLRLGCGRVPDACGYSFEASPKPPAPSDSAGYKPSQPVFNPSLAPLGLHRSPPSRTTLRSSPRILLSTVCGCGHGGTR